MLTTDSKRLLLYGYTTLRLAQVLQDAGDRQRRRRAAVHPVHSGEHGTDTRLVPVGYGGVLVRLSCYRLLCSHHHCWRLTSPSPPRCYIINVFVKSTKYEAQFCAPVYCVVTCNLRKYVNLFSTPTIIYCTSKKLFVSLYKLF